MFCGDPGRNRNETGEPLPRDNPKYEKALSRAAAEITDMLYKMRLAKESIFLSVPVALHQKNHLKTFFHGLRAELAQRYRVEVGLSAGDHAAMAEAKLSVHFIGQERDDRTVDLIDIAIGGDRPCVIFSVSEGTGEPSGPMAVYREYLEGRMRESTPNKISVSAVTPGKYTISEIVRWMGELIPKHASDTVRLKPKLVYLMCHPDCSKDSDFLRVRDLLAKEECLRLSSADTRDPADYYRYHLRTFGECDGLMLFWGGTDTGWFQKWYGSVKNWRPYRNGKPFKSKAVCLLPPPQQKRESIKSDLLPDELVLEFFLDNDFSSLRLESFIEPLRPVRR
jgi:hypothetical protein